MKITFVRHTSVDVPQGICYGKTDVPLAITFRNEREIVKQNLSSEKFEVVYSSPLSRCTILASSIIPENEIRIDSRLQEFDFGDWEMADWNALFESGAGKIWFADYVNTQCPNGESFADQIFRVQSFIGDLQKEKMNDVLVFAHAGTIRAAMCIIQKISPEEAFQIPVGYGQLVTFNFENMCK